MSANMASTFYPLLVVLCLALAIASSELSSYSADSQDDRLEESPSASGGRLVNTRETAPEKTSRHLRPLERPSSPWEPRPFERPGPIGQLRPMIQPEPVGQLRPMIQPGPVGQLRPMIQPGHVGQLRPMIQPEPVGQLRPMYRPEIERSRTMPDPETSMAMLLPLPQAELGADPSLSRGVASQAPKPGQCPVTECRGNFANIGTRSCMSDAQCPGAEKCCLNPCLPGRICIQAGLHVHPGSCPAQESCISTNYVFKVVCQDDVQCSPDTKCCYDQCTSLYVCKSVAGQWPPGPPPPRPVWPPVPPGPVWPPAPPGPDWFLPPNPNPSKPDRCISYCPGSMRCCDHLTRPGSCPASARCYSREEDSALSQSVTVCEGDYDCIRSDKCCHDLCLRRMACRTMVYDPKVHPGQCPEPAPRCDQTQVEKKTPCTDDRSCLLHERCCSSPCYRTLVCMAALNGLPAPPTRPLPPPGPDPTECTTYCPGTKRCCDGVEKNGFCPAPGKCVGALINPPKTCANDYECDGGDKCCQDSCSTLKVCRTAVASPTVHPGVCPPPSSACAVQPLSSQPMPNECSQDMECTMEQRCCRDQCKGRMTCQYTNIPQPPEPPQPPSPPDPPQPPAPKPCQVYCPGSKVCCDDGEKEGYCPAPALCVGMLLRPPLRCLKDYDCSDADKCCFDDCQKQNYCRPAVPHRAVHPGSCPRTQTSCVGYNSQGQKQCQDDSACRFEQRCCYNGCMQQKICLQAEVPGTTGPNPPSPPCSVYCPGTKDCCDNKSKLGNCPAASTCGGALLNPLPRCTVDYHCRGSDKCCFDACEKDTVCRQAMTNNNVHPGKCPVQQNCQPFPLKPMPQCAVDSDCRFEQRCCYDTCHRHQLCKRADLSLNPPLPGCTIPCPHDASTCCDTKVKPGYCPWPFDCRQGASNVGQPNTPAECQGPDYSCEGTEKCCYDNCQQKWFCRPSVYDPFDHLGYCPAVQTSCIAVRPTSSMECRNDSSCRSDQKCCPDTCEKKSICKIASAIPPSSVSISRASP